MQLDPEYLRQHYASLSDEALMEMDRADLVDMAKTIFDLEVSNRKLARPPETRGNRPARPDPLVEDEDDDAEIDNELLRSAEEPEWADEAIELSSFSVPSATAPSEGAMNARRALDAAGIPCYLELSEFAPETSLLPYGTHRWRLMTQSHLTWHAASVLEREISNPEFEELWRAHLEALPDAELRELDPQDELCGLYDRLERVERAYDEEIARRKRK